MKDTLPVVALTIKYPAVSPIPKIRKTQAVAKMMLFEATFLTTTSSLIGVLTIFLFFIPFHYAGKKEKNKEFLICNF